VAQVSICIALCSLLLAGVAEAQQVRYVDLTAEPQRERLRHPPAKPTGQRVGGGIGSAAVSDGAPDHRDPRALEVSLASIGKDSYRLGELMLYEIVLKNVGSVSVEIPVHPHLSDLQPNDASVSFDYLQLQFAFDLRRPAQALTFRGASLYGGTETPGSILKLDPGQWIRVRGVATFEPAGEVVPAGAWELGPRLSMQQVTFVPKPGGSHTRISNMYPRMITGATRSVQIEQE
jgi:hypothetical protein